MSHRTLCCLCYALCALLVQARSGGGFCGTYPDNWREEIDRHERNMRRLAADPVKMARMAARARRDADVGNVAVIESDDSIFGRRNPFSLDKFQVVFTPSAGRYAYATSEGGFDQAAAGSGTPVAGLGDDDSRRVPLPFPFPFFGNSYREVWLNSDGNLTFTEGDNASSARSLGRMAAGPPRIAGLFTDLDPTAGSGSVRILATADAFVVTWLRVPEYSDFGAGRPQSFQIRLTPDGRIAYAWDGVVIDDGVVGISPGDTLARPLLASFVQTRSGSHDAMIAERFGDAQALDLVSAARRFYETHEDAYDYLAFFNSAGVSPGTGVLAFETTVRTHRRGIGDTLIDVGRQYGSQKRLQAVLNMGPLSNFPANPNTAHPLRFSTGDTGLTVLAHEIGHLFLAFASVRNPASPAARPMLGRQLFHWNFRFNSDASILEGNRIRDDGPEARPRFTTTATVQGFSALDQYLMGLRAPEEVPATFLVENASTTLVDPRVGVSFNGDRRDVTVDELISVEGRRTPDHTVEQRRFRIAFILIVPEGGQAKPEELALLERYREELESAWPRYTGERGAMEVSLRRNLSLSIEPAAGAIAGRDARLEVALQQPANQELTVNVSGANGLLEGPSTITIPAGARTAAATYRTPRAGVETLRAEPRGDAGYSAAEARLAINEPSALQLRIESGNRQIATGATPLAAPVVVKLTDVNDLPYANVRIVAEGGTVTPASALTDTAGRASFQWTPAAQPPNFLRFLVEGLPVAPAEAIALGRPVFSAAAVVNAASFQAGLTPGGIATIFGANLAQPQITVDGARAQVFYADDRQVNFAVPALASTAATAAVEVRTALGTAAAAVPLFAVQPGIFFDAATGRAAAIDRGQRIFEMYGTGFGAATQVTAQVGGRPAGVLFHGLAPGFIGLFQTNVQVDPAVPAGDQPAFLTAANVRSNEVKLAIAP